MVSMATVLLNVGLNIALVRVMSFRGLALGTAISAVCNAAILLWVLRGRLGGLDGRRIGLAMGKIGVASALMGLAAWGTDWAVASALPSHALPVLALRVGTAIGVGVIVLDVAARAIRIEEFLEARATVVARLKRLRGLW
jgi:putative peptidoglycan lipid II flippase